MEFWSDAGSGACSDPITLLLQHSITPYVYWLSPRFLTRGQPEDVSD
jgi:hypothetical protein